HFAELFEQFEIVHIAGPDLQDIDIGCGLFDAFGIKHFRYRNETIFLGRFCEELNPLEAHSLELIGRGAGLVSASPQGWRAIFGSDPGAFENLSLRFDRTGTRDDERLLIAADFDSPDLDHGPRGARMDASEFLLLFDKRDLFDP